jgi:hypothetical protein
MYITFAGLSFVQGMQSSKVATNLDWPHSRRLLGTHRCYVILLFLHPLVVVRWYGPGEPGKVFVERKTHRESWKVNHCWPCYNINT